MSPDPQFWHGRWEEGFTPWHQGRVNACLERHFPLLGLDEGDEVLVPMCGKAVDMRWLMERRCRVLGVELSERAARAFFDDHGLRHEVRREGPFTVIAGGGVRILCGDVFALAADHVGSVRVVYDRAALGALDTQDRDRYAAHLCTLLPAGAPQLVVTLDYDPARMTGPPFAVGAPEMHRLYDGRYRLRLLGSTEVIDEEPRFRERGLESLTEHAFYLLDNTG